VVEEGHTARRFGDKTDLLPSYSCSVATPTELLIANSTLCTA